MEKWVGRFRQMKTETWILLLLAGVLLVVIALPAGKRKENGTGQGETADTYGGTEESENGGSLTEAEIYGKKVEKRVEEILASIDGVGKVKVMVTLESGGESIVSRDESSEENTVKETDSEGGTRLTREKNISSQTILAGDDDSPYVTKELCPKITGIIVCAEGGGEAYVKAEISGAMEALFDLPPHKIKVLKRVKEES